MDGDEESWIAALDIVRHLGTFAPIWVDERIMTLGRDGDTAAVARLHRIARCIAGIDATPSAALAPSRRLH